MIKRSLGEFDWKMFKKFLLPNGYAFVDIRDCPTSRAGRANIAGIQEMDYLRDEEVLKWARLKLGPEANVKRRIFMLGGRIIMSINCLV